MRGGCVRLSQSQAPNTQLNIEAPTRSARQFALGGGCLISIWGQLVWQKMAKSINWWKFKMFKVCSNVRCVRDCHSMSLTLRSGPRASWFVVRSDQRSSRWERPWPTPAAPLKNWWASCFAKSLVPKGPKATPHRHPKTTSQLFILFSIHSRNSNEQTFYTSRCRWPQSELFSTMTHRRSSNNIE